MQHILGQKRVVESLMTAIQAGRVPHAYLFQGPQGVGKYTTARALGTLLLCHNPVTTLMGELEACGTCNSCRLFAGELEEQTQVPNHPDFHVVRKELARFSDNRQIRERKLTAIPVEVLRDHFLDHVYRAPQMGHGKFFVIDESDLLSISGQNLILKTLEEPPEATYIVLISSKPDRVLPTIRSRVHCQQFWPLEYEIVRTWLEKRIQQREEATPDENEMNWVTTFAQGSLGKAWQAIEYNLYGWHSMIGGVLNDLRHGGYQADMVSRMMSLQENFVESWLKTEPKASKEAVNKISFGLLCEIFAGLIYHYCHQDWKTRSNLYINSLNGIQEAELLVARNVKLSMAVEKLLLDSRLELIEAL